MSRQQAGVAVADGLVDENPAMLPIRLLEKPVIPERGNGSTWKHPLVHRTLDERAFPPTAFGDNGRMTGDVDAIDPVLPLPHPQRSNLDRLRMRIQFAPGLRGRVIQHVRWPVAHG